MAADMDPEEMEEWRTIFNLFDVDGDESITCEVRQGLKTWNQGKPSFKKKRFFMKNFHKMETPPRIVFVKSLFRFFYRKFRDKIKMRQNSVNHSKFRFSTRLMQGITLLHYYQTHQGILFWPKTCHFELLNFWIRVWKQTDPPPFVKVFHKIPVFFKGWLPLAPAAAHWRHT